MKMHKCLRIAAFLFCCLASATTAFAQSNLEKARTYLASNDYLNAAPHVVAAVNENPKNLEVLLLAGDVYRELEKLDSALMFYQRAEKIDDASNVLRKVAIALSELGKHTEAIAKMQEALKEDKDDVYNHLVLGQVYINADSLQRADLAIRRAQSINSDIADTYVALGDLYYAQKVYELAKANYDEAITRNATLLEPRIKLARTNYRLANSGVEKDEANEYFVASLKAWDEVTQLDTNNATAFYEKGRILFFAKKYVDAARALHRYTVLRPDGQLGRWYLAQSFYELRVYDSAQVYLQTVAIDSVQDKKASMLARSYMEVKDYARSAAMYAAIQQKGALEQEDLDRYGYASILSGDTVTAIATFKKSIELNPKNCTLVFRVGNLLRQRQEYADAIAILKKRLEHCPDSLSSTVSYLIGVSYYSAGNVDSAIIALQESIKADSNSLQPYIQLGRAYFERDSVAAGQEVLTMAIEKAKIDTAANSRVIEQAFAMRCGKYLDAKQYDVLKKVTAEWVALLPDSEYGNLYKAISHQGLGESDQACKHYKKVLKINPNSKPAKENMSALGC